MSITLKDQTVCILLTLQLVQLFSIKNHLKVFWIKEMYVYTHTHTYIYIMSAHDLGYYIVLKPIQ